MDVVVTVPKSRWDHWLSEGGLPGSRDDNEYGFTVSSRPDIEPGERVYIVAGGKLRGYAPLTRVAHAEMFRYGRSKDYAFYRGKYSLVRNGKAKAVTIPEDIKGFRGYRYRWWRRRDETTFRDWQVL